MPRKNKSHCEAIVDGVECRRSVLCRGLCVNHYQQLRVNGPNVVFTAIKTVHHLTKDEVQEIIRVWSDYKKAKLAYKNLTFTFGVTRQAINNLVKGKTLRSIEVMK